MTTTTVPTGRTQHHSRFVVLDDVGEIYGYATAASYRDAERMASTVLPEIGRVRLLRWDQATRAQRLAAEATLVHINPRMVSRLNNRAPVELWAGELTHRFRPHRAGAGR